ncbi:MAG: hypothetical protein LBK01_03265, partial [Burkholderiaceae bacterium]|nr:hypothetical protein [Burkholderiaceae bacterium]
TDWTNNASLATDFQQPGMDISGEKWTPNPVIDALVNRATEHVKVNRSPDDAKTGTAIPGITVQNLKNMESNAAFSLANTLGTIVNPFMGVPATFFGSQRMSSNQFLRDAEEKLRDAAQKPGSVLSDEALLEKLDQVRDLSIKNGLWEAVPETASNLLFGGILKANAVGPLKQVFRKVFGEGGEQAFAKWAQHAGAKIASGTGKLGASIGEELATETVTQMGQSQTEYDANARFGLPNKEKRREWTNLKDWGKSFDEVAPDTILQSLLTFGSGSVVNRGTRLAGAAMNQENALAGSELGNIRAEDFLREGQTQRSIPVEPVSQAAPTAPAPERQNADLIPESQAAPESELAALVSDIEPVQQNQTTPGTPIVFDNPTDALVVLAEANKRMDVDHRIVENADGTYTIEPVEMVAQEIAPQAAPIPDEAHPVDSETGEIVSQERANLRHQAEHRDADTKILEGLKALSTKELLGRLKNVEQYERVYGRGRRTLLFRRKVEEILAGRGVQENAEAEPAVFSRGWRLSSAKTISDFVKKIVPEKGKHPKEVLVAGRVSEHARQRILDATGIDLGDARILVTADSIWHSQKAHPGMSTADYNKLMWTIENFDDVVLAAEPGRSKSQRFLFSAYDKGTGYGYVADVSLGKNHGNRLNTVTFFKDSAENVANWKNQERLRVEKKKRGSDVPTEDAQGTTVPEGTSAANTASDESVPQNSRARQSKVAFPLTRRQVINTADFVLKGMKRAPSVVVVDRVADLPFEAPADARGAYRDGTVYVVAENAASIEGVKETVFHEVRGHFGLRGFFGNALDNALVGINNANPSIRGLADTWIANNQDVVHDLKSRYDWTNRDVRALAIEEAMAQMAERGQTISGIQRFAAAVQSLLRKMGMSRLANMLEARTDAEAMHMLAQADLFLQTGETAESRSSREAEAAQAYSRGEKRLSSAEIVSRATPDRQARTLNEAEEQAKAFVGKPLRNEDTGIVATVSRNNIGKMKSRKALDKSSSPENHALAIANADKLFKHALFDHSHPDRDGERTIREIRRYVAPMIGHNGNVLVVKMTVKETANEKTPNPLYSIETIDVEKPARDASNEAVGLGTGISNEVAATPTSGLVFNVQQIAQKVKDAVQEVSERDKNIPPLFSRAGEEGWDRTFVLQSETYAMPAHRVNTLGGIGRGPLAEWL